MAHPLDIFYAVAGKGTISIAELKELFLTRSATSQSIYYAISKLVKEGFVIKEKGILKIIENEKSQALFQLISFCVHNDLSYTFYFEQTTLAFLSKIAFQQSFTLKELSFHPATQQKILRRLEKDSFIVVYKKKPYTARLLKHSFLEKLLSYHLIPTHKGGQRIPLMQLHGYLRSKRKELRSLRPLNRVGFIHASLALEGNLLTIRETEALLQEHITPHKQTKDSLEVVHYNDALTYVDELLTNKKTLGLSELLRLHAKTMAHEQHAGTLRKEKVVITNNPSFQIASHKDIPSLLNEFFSSFNTFRSKHLTEIIEQAAYFHNQFQYIHPFLDGNSRTTRLLLYYFLRLNEVNFTDIPLGFTTEYLSLTKGYTKRSDHKLSRFLKELLIQLVEK